MNDNITADSPHHAECLHLLNDLHDLLAWAQAMGLKVETDDASFNYAMDFGFWRGECARVLSLDAMAAA